MSSRRLRPPGDEHSVADAESAQQEHVAAPVPVPIPGAPSHGRGFDSAAAGMVLAMQQRAGNQAVQRYLEGRTLQREEAAGATAQPAATGQAAPAPGAAASGKTANLRLSALYENVPGKAKNVVRRADANDALFFDPLHMKSEHPTALKKTTSRGVVAGGETTIDTFAAPMTQKDPSVGRGSITAQLKYADNVTTNVDVQVGGLTKKETPAAKAIAEKAVQREMKDLGDIEEIAKVAEAEVKQTYPNATVSIGLKSKGADQVVDAGRSTFFYKVRGGTNILMEVRVLPAGEQQARYGESKSKSQGTQDETSSKQRTEREQVDVKKDVKDSERKTGVSKETTSVAYNKAVVHTIDDYVQKAGTVRKKVASKLATHVVKDSTYKDDDKWVSKREFEEIKDYTKNVEKGERDKENWAAKLKKWTGLAKKVTSLPIRLPKWLRRVKGWWIEAIDWGVGQLAETGKVQYEDTKEHDKRTGKDDTTITRDRDVTRKDDETTTRELQEEYETTTKDDWERHLKELTTVKEDYNKVVEKSSDEKTDKSHTEDYSKTGTKEEKEAAERHAESQNQVTTTNFEVSTTYKFTVPQIKARVVAGDGEVHHEPFPAEPGETTENLP